MPYFINIQHDALRVWFVPQKVPLNLSHAHLPPSVWHQLCEMSRLLQRRHGIKPLEELLNLVSGGMSDLHFHINTTRSDQRRVQSVKVNI